MITLDLHYAKESKYEDEELEYKTWFWNDETINRKNEPDYGWNKRPVPNFTSSEEKLATEWFKTSNREDLIFLEKELIACQYWYDKEKNEINKHDN